MDDINIVMDDENNYNNILNYEECDANEDQNEDENDKEVLEQFNKGDKIKCVIFGIDADRERISLKLSE